MIVSGDYAIEYYKNENRIEICLPQTVGTIRNTIQPVSLQEYDISSADLLLLLNTVKTICEEWHNDGQM